MNEAEYLIGLKIGVRQFRKMGSHSIERRNHASPSRGANLGAQRIGYHVRTKLRARLVVMSCSWPSGPSLKYLCSNIGNETINEIVSC